MTRKIPFKLTSPMTQLAGKTPKAIVLLILLGISDSSVATNGLNQIGFGTESVGMAGADLALGRDTSALNTNSAGLTQIQGALLDQNIAVAYTGNIKHKDQFGNNRDNSNEYPVLGSFGYARRYVTRREAGLIQILLPAV